MLCYTLLYSAILYSTLYPIVSGHISVGAHLVGDMNVSWGRQINNQEVKCMLKKETCHRDPDTNTNTTVPQYSMALANHDMGTQNVCPTSPNKMNGHVSLEADCQLYDQSNLDYMLVGYQPNDGHHLGHHHGQHGVQYGQHLPLSSVQADRQPDLLKDSSVAILNEAQNVITSETPLINGLYYPDYAANVSL